MNRFKLYLFLFLASLGAYAQEKPVIKEAPKFDGKEEIIYDGKRYKIHNSYLTAGAGFLQSSMRNRLQQTIGVDFQFPIRKLNFQMGAMMSGESFGSNNNIQGHVGYGIRREKTRNNLALYAGPTLFTGVIGDATSSPVFYTGVGAYVSLQAVTKFTYDIGLGAELFGEISSRQRIFGIKIIAFFSGAYRGPKRNFNPNVRSENPK